MDTAKLSIHKRDMDVCPEFLRTPVTVSVSSSRTTLRLRSSTAEEAVNGSVWLWKVKYRVPPAAAVTPRPIMIPKMADRATIFFFPDQKEEGAVVLLPPNMPFEEEVCLAWMVAAVPGGAAAAALRGLFIGGNIGGVYKARSRWEEAAPAAGQRTGPTPGPRKGRPIGRSAVHTSAKNL